MANLHQIVSGAIGTVNPNVPVTLQRSTGYAPPSAANNYKPTPTYAVPVSLIAQVQELTSKDLRQLDALNIQGSQKKIYLNGVVESVVRVTQKGGDLITLADGNVWLTTQVLEQWPDWVAVSVTLQDGS